MTDKTELQEMLTFARQTITAAGAIALQYFRAPLKVENKAGGGRFDPVTRADREIESYIRERISTTYPEHAIVGEEAGMRTGRDNYRWFIDPIDGTKAYISGMPLWGILLGLMEAGACRFGLMYQPYLQELYIGSEQGAYLCKGVNTQTMTTRVTRNLAEAILYCTHPAMFRSEQDLQLFHRVAERCKLMRYGGDCYAYCLLALGFIDLVIEADLKSHDIVPLIPIIEAAGGTVTDWQGNSASKGGRVIASANASLHEQALNLLQQPVRSVISHNSREVAMELPKIAQASPIAVTVEAGKTYHWCACGLSNTQPFCDGSHKGTGYAPVHWQAPASEVKYFCACKRTGNRPLCDGSHKKLA